MKIISIIATVLVLFLTTILLGHHFKNQRIAELNFSYDRLGVNVDLKQEIVCVLNVAFCHWSYLLVKEIWRNDEVQLLLGSKNIKLSIIDVKDGIQFVRRHKLPHIAEYPCTIFIDDTGTEVKRQYGLFSLDTLKNCCKFINPI